MTAQEGSLKTVGEIMSRPVITVNPSDKLAHALSLMVKKNIGALVVVSDDEPVGILTERDIVRNLILRGEAEFLNTEVSSIMSKPPITCGPEYPIVKAFILMYEKRIRRLPVVEEGRLVGIVTERDLVYWVIKLLGYPESVVRGS